MLERFRRICWLLRKNIAGSAGHRRIRFHSGRDVTRHPARGRRYFPMTKTSNTRLMIAAITALFLYGAIASMLGTLLPDLSAQFHMTAKQNGSIASMQALGLVLASIVAGPLIDSRGKKTGFLGGMALIVISLFALPNSVGWKTIMAAMFVLGG